MSLVITPHNMYAVGIQCSLPELGRVIRALTITVEIITSTLESVQYNGGLSSVGVFPD